VKHQRGRTKKLILAGNAAAAVADEREDKVGEGGRSDGARLGMEHHPSEANRTSGMTVHLTGLSLAHKLGLLSSLKHKAGEEVLEELSSKLSKAAGFLWLQRDDLGRVRHVTYVDSTCDSPASFEIGPGWLVTARKIKTRGPTAAQEESRKRQFCSREDWLAVFDYV
jgi:hypothetical protein